MPVGQALQKATTVASVFFQEIDFNNQIPEETRRIWSAQVKSLHMLLLIQIWEVESQQPFNFG